MHKAQAQRASHVPGQKMGHGDGLSGGMNTSQQAVQQPNPFVSGPGQANMAQMIIKNEEQMKMMQQMRMMQMESKMPQMPPLQPNHLSHVNSHQMNFALAAMQQQMHLLVHQQQMGFLQNDIYKRLVSQVRVRVRVSVCVCACVCVSLSVHVYTQRLHMQTYVYAR